MALPRCLTVDPTVSCHYHTWSRCTRRLDLLNDIERRDMFIARLEFLAGIFAIEVCEFAIMANHVHTIVRPFPELAWAWTDEEIAIRWLILRGRVDENGSPKAKAVGAIVGNPARVDELRRRLADLGWFHKELKEHLARAWNKRDRVTGHFWEGRYGAEIAERDLSLVNQAIYVLLNRIRCGAESSVGESEATSIGRRIARLVDEIRNGQHADALAEFENRFERSDWTPVFPCDPGSVRDMNDEEFARRVARGRQRAAVRSALADEGMMTAYASIDLPAEEIAPHVIPSGGTHSPRPSPISLKGVRRRKAIGARMPPRLSEDAWLTVMENPFSQARIGSLGAVPVLPGMTLAMLVQATDEEGRRERADKPGRIAAETPAALDAFRVMVLAAQRSRDDGASAAAKAADRPKGPDPSEGAAGRPNPGPIGESIRTLLESVRMLAARQRERIARIFGSEGTPNQVESPPTDAKANPPNTEPQRTENDPATRRAIWRALRGASRARWRDTPA